MPFTPSSLGERKPFSVNFQLTLRRSNSRSPFPENLPSQRSLALRELGEYVLSGGRRAPGAAHRVWRPVPTAPRDRGWHPATSLLSGLLLPQASWQLGGPFRPFPCMVRMWSSQSVPQMEKLKRKHSLESFSWEQPKRGPHGSCDSTGPVAVPARPSAPLPWLCPAPSPPPISAGHVSGESASRLGAVVPALAKGGEPPGLVPASALV